MTKQPRTTADHQPDNEYEAMMSAMPFHEPEMPSENLMELRDRVAEYVEQLEPRLQWIINGIISEGKSLQDIAEELAYTKTHIWRLRNQAFEELRNLMSADTVIRKAVRMAETWDQSAAQWVSYLASSGEINEPITYEDLDAYMEVIVDIVNNDIETINLELLYGRIAQRTILLLRKMEAWDTGEMIATLCSKQHDYGHGNINRFGLKGITVRLSDKIERYKNLEGREAKNESTCDTLVDIVGYCVVALMYLDETFQLELGEDYGTTEQHA